MRSKVLAVLATVGVAFTFLSPVPVRADNYDLVSRLTGNPSYVYTASPADWPLARAR